MKAAILMPEKKAPLVYLDFAILSGSVNDPPGKEGTAGICLSLLLRGTAQGDAAHFHERLDSLGAEIHLGKYKESLRIHGICLASKLEAFLGLLEELLLQPAFLPEEFERVKAQLRSSFLDELGSDEEIADRRFQEYILWGHPYGRATAGGLETLDKIKLEDVSAFYREHFRASNILVGAAGGFNGADLKKWLKRVYAKLPKGKVKAVEVKAPKFSPRRLLLLEKPQRTQAQLIIGAPGVAYNHADYFPLLIANHVFGGGSFSARLMKEVREKRGWSYGAYSWFRSSKQPLYFAMQCTPSNKDTVAAFNLMVSLFEGYAKKGVTKSEFQFAKESLLNQSAFLQDSVRKRLDHRMSEAVLGLKKGYYDGYRKRLRAVTFARVQAAVKRHMKPQQLFGLLLGSSSEWELKKLKGFKDRWNRPFDGVPGPLEKGADTIVVGSGKRRKPAPRKFR
jgi:zinc protease